MGRIGSLSILWGGASLVLACGEPKRPPLFDPIPNPDVPHERLPEQSSAFEETRCSAKAEGFVTQCGKVTVPEGPDSDRMIELAVVRVFTDSDEPKDDPVVYLDGGPGVPSIDGVDAMFSLMHLIDPDRDFIYFDQRGVGESEPALDCPDDGSDDPFNDKLARCYDNLSEDWDLNAFNTRNNAADVDLIRKAFGYDEWNLFGVSYGSRLALTVMRDHPEGVRSVILDALVPLQIDLMAGLATSGYQSFSRVVEACEAQQTCAEKYPDIEGQLLQVVEELNEEPVVIGRYLHSGSDIAHGLFNLLYSPWTISEIPLIIDEMANGKFETYESYLSVALGPRSSFGMHLAVNCADEWTFTSVETIEEGAQALPEQLRDGFSGTEYKDYCENFPVAPSPASENEIVESDLPTLLFGGHFDPITPPGYSEAAAEGLSNAQYFYVENGSHGSVFTECGRTLAGEFLHDPSAELSPACFGNLPELEFLSDAAISSSSQRIAGSIVMRTTPLSDAERELAKRELQEALRRAGRL